LARFHFSAILLASLIILGLGLGVAAAQDEKEELPFPSVVAEDKKPEEPKKAETKKEEPKPPEKVEPPKVDVKKEDGNKEEPKKEEPKTDPLAELKTLSETGAEAAKNEGLRHGDNAWILTASALVMLMTPGLALFYGGMARCRATPPWRSWGCTGWRWATGWRLARRKSRLTCGAWKTAGSLVGTGNCSSCKASNRKKN
jgi:hypothetical protein